MNTDLISKRTKRYGLKGIIKTYLENDKSKIRKGIVITSSLTVLCLFPLCFSEIESYDFLVKVNEKVFSLVPNLLGFNFAAFTLFVGFGGAEFLKTTVGFEEEKQSFYQTNTSIFGFSLILQATAVLLSFFLGVIVDMELVIDSVQLATIINVLAIVALMFLAFFSTYIVVDLITNVFNLSQNYHFFLWVNKSKK